MKNTIRKTSLGLYLVLALLCLALTSACTTGRNPGAIPAGVDELPAAGATGGPTTDPAQNPTAEPIVECTVEPAGEPTAEPTAEPTEEPAAEPTEEPAAEPTENPTEEPVDAEAIAAPIFEAMKPLLIHEGYLLDMDGDGVAEIITRSGTCEADAVLSVYACETGGARLIGTATGSNCQLWGHADGGLVVQYGHMGVEQVDWVKIEGGALQTTLLIEQHEVAEYTRGEDWISIEPCA